MAKGVLARLFKIEPGISLGQWLYDRITNNWTWLVAIFGGGGLSYLAAISEWIKPWGLVGYGAVGLVAALLIYLVLTTGYAAIGKARERNAQAEYIKGRSHQVSVNVLAPVHDYEKIDLIQFFSHFYLPTENVRFENCNLMGPFMIAIDGCQFLNCRFIDCEIVIARSDRPVKGATMFKFCTLVRCKIFRVTFVMNYDAYKKMPAEFRTGVAVISDGRIGDV
jgi:hypothetical protein